MTRPNIIRAGERDPRLKDATSLLLAVQSKGGERRASLI